MSTKEILQRLMERQNISARALAKETRTNRSTLSSILMGTNRSPRESTLEPYAQYFGVTLAQLRGYEPIPGLTSGDPLPNEYPVVAPTHVDDWVREASTKSDFDRFVPSAIPKDARTFVFVVPDDAVADIVERGELVFVDPDFEFPADSHLKRLALIRYQDQYSIRYETTDLGQKVYRSNITGFRTLTENDCVFIGYVIAIPERPTIPPALANSA